MEVGRLSESLEYVSCSGVFIRAEKLEFLKNSLVLLQKENHFRKIYYWGKIIGSENDYHIAYGYIKDCIKDQIYYYRYLFIIVKYNKQMITCLKKHIT